MRAGPSSILYLQDDTANKNDYRKAEIVRVIQVCLGFLFFIFHSIVFLGFFNTLLFFISSFFISLLLEIIGANKGYIFGKYSYEPKLCPGPLIGNVPILIALSWTGLIYMSLNYSFMIFGINFNDLITLENILLTSLLVTILDLVLDPIAVDEGRWKWQSPGKYYGIPIKNFFGWFLNTVIILLFYELFSKEHFLNEKFEFYVTYSPGILFMLLPIIAARPCFERKLLWAGIIGVVFTFILASLMIFRFQ
tara:strand:- start:205 stop:954 length:750 start_codon:yes stop_codon:yes gene_type:complete